MAGSPALILEDPREQAKIWQVREAAVGDDLPRSAARRRLARLGRRRRGSGAPRRLPARSERASSPAIGYGAAFYGHFGEGCLHARINFDFTTPEGVRRYRTFMEEAADLVVSHGGSLSGEHGDGQARGELLPRMFGEELVEAFREFKAIWDPRNRMNPGKMVDPLPLDVDLRLATPGRTRRPPSAIPETTAASPAPPAAAWGSASAGVKT